MKAIFLFMIQSLFLKKLKNYENCFENHLLNRFSQWNRINEKQVITHN